MKFDWRLMIKYYSFSLFFIFILGSSLGNSNFGNSNINLYNNYASASYATYTAPQYTTANPNRCPANANIKASSSDAASIEQDNKTTNKQLPSIRYSQHVLRKSKLDNGKGSGDTVVANKHGRQFNESVIEEGHNNNSVSTFFFLSLSLLHTFINIWFMYISNCNAILQGIFALIKKRYELNISIINVHRFTRITFV